MAIDIDTDDTDDTEFLAHTTAIVRSLAASLLPEDVLVFRIDNWFDHKWLKFSGMGRVEFDHPHPDHPQVVLDEFHRDKVTFPPFSPNRILGQWYFSRPTDRERRPVLEARKEKTAWNLQRRVIQFSQSGVFVWFASNSRPNGRGSVMVYTVEGERVTAWYGSFVKGKAWKIDRVKGIDRDAVETLMSSRQVDRADEYSQEVRVLAGPGRTET